MAPATEECGPTVVSAVQEAEDLADDVTPSAPPTDSCCDCCACWQRRKHSRPPRGTDKVGSTDTDTDTDRETLLSGGKTRFYCCESKMTTRPRRGPIRVRNSASETPETATEVSPGLCSLFKVRGRKSGNCGESGLSPVDFAYDAFDERAYMEEFEVIHQEEYDVSRKIVNPMVPHSEILKRPSQVGRAIIIEGKVHPNAQRFAVNLICREKNDIAMHFNPRLDRQYIARNTKLDGHWGDEENSLNGPSPFQSGKEFILHVLVTEEEYRFCHNGRHICSYKHRVPIARLHILDIHGDLTLSMVKHEMMEEYPPPVSPVSMEDLMLEPQLLSVGHTPLLIPTTTTGSWRADIPKQSYLFLGRFKPNLSINNEIVIEGNVRLLPHAFFINLQDGLQMWKLPEVHLHINPRFEDHNHTVINARLKGAWGYEERHLRCRFQPGQPFTLTIRVEKDRYLTSVNGCVLASMDHRARPSEINSLYISGDVDITGIGFTPDFTTVKSTRPENEETIAGEDWIDLGLNDEVSSRPTNGRESESRVLIAGVEENVLTTAEAKRENKVLSLREPERAREKKKSDSLQEEVIAGGPHHNDIMPENFEPPPLPSTSKAAGKSVTGTGSLQSGLAVATAGQLERLASAVPTVEDRGKSESASAVSTSVPRKSESKDGLVGSTRLTDSLNLNGQPPQLETRNSVLTHRTETEVSDGRTRGDSVVSDDSIFLSAQHSFEPSIDSKRNSLDESPKSDFVSSSAKPKTDNEKKSNGKNSKES